MKPLTLIITCVACNLTLLHACKPGQTDSGPPEKDELQPSAEIQKALNEKYAQGLLDQVDINARRALATEGQFPKAYIYSLASGKVTLIE